MKSTTFGENAFPKTDKRVGVLSADSLEREGWPEDWPDRPAAVPGASMNFVPHAMRKNPPEFTPAGTPWPEPKTTKVYTPSPQRHGVIPSEMFVTLLGRTAEDLRALGLNVDSEVPDHALLARDLCDSQQLYFEVR